MRPYRVALVIATAGLLTFGVVFSLLEVTRSDAAAGQATSAGVAAPAAIGVARAADSISPALAAGQSAVGVPTTGSEPLLRDVQPGDRLDVLASLPTAPNGRPSTGVIVRGATVVRPASDGNPLVIEVPTTDAIVLAHLVMGGTRLGFVIWPANGESPAPKAMDEQTARALLGLTVASIPPTPGVPPEPTAPPAAPSPTVTAQPTAASTSGFIYQAQPGDTWAAVAAMFSVPEADLRRWNEVPSDAVLEPGTILFVPRRT